MDRKDYLKEPVDHIKIKGTLTVDQLMQQSKTQALLALDGWRQLVTFTRRCSGKKTALSSWRCRAVVPAGMRTIVSDLIRNHLVM